MHGAYDVLVIGGGVSGVAAAVAAARQGARTCLVEGEGFFGGIGYAGLLRHICGLYLNGDNTPTETLNKGLAREVVALLNTLSPERSVKENREGLCPALFQGRPPVCFQFLMQGRAKSAGLSEYDSSIGQKDRMRK